MCRTISSHKHRYFVTINLTEFELKFTELQPVPQKACLGGPVDPSHEVMKACVIVCLVSYRKRQNVFGNQLLGKIKKTKAFCVTRCIRLNV